MEPTTQKETIQSMDFYTMFSFELSNWQKQALQSINDGNHCLVTAPTGSGKTLPAEYAIRHFTNSNKKVIYTIGTACQRESRITGWRDEIGKIIQIVVCA